MAQSLDNLSRTWSDAGTTFTAIKYDITDSGSGVNSLLMDLRVGSASKFKVTKSGRVDVPNGSVTNVSMSYGPGFSNYGLAWTPSGGGHALVNVAGSQGKQSLTTFGVVSFNTGYYGFCDNANSEGGFVDLTLFRDAANTLAQRNGANGQTFRLYGTYTDATIAFERFFIEAPSAAGAAVKLGTQKGTGASARALEFQTDGTTRLTISATANIVTVEELRALYLNINQFGGLNADANGVFRLRDATASGLATLRFGGTTSSFPALKRSSAALQVRLADDTANAALESASVKTDAPAGGTSGTWKLGVAATVSPTSPDRTIEVDIGGTIYYIAAKTTND